ncbi:MAG: OmpH family outer membrane protein [bacterium]
MKSKKSLMGSLILALFLFGAQTAAAKELKIGVVDFQKVFDQSAVIKKLNSELEQKVKAEEEIITKKRETLQKQKEDLDKQQSILSPEKRTDREGQIRQDLKDLQRYATDKQDEFQRKGSELMQSVMQELTKIVQEIGERDSYTTIIERSEGGLVFSSPSIDITDEVVKEYDKRSKK